jgi:hypothetical protein
MGYYIRILSPSDAVPSFAKLQAIARKHQAKLEDEPKEDDDWTQIVLCHENGPEIASIERSTVADGDLVRAEVQEFLDEIPNYQPASAVEWLTDFLPTVRTIYAFQLLSGTEESNGWGILWAVKDTLFAQVGGIFQADGEGFSDPEGFHILWQFSDSVSGSWWMGCCRMASGCIFKWTWPTSNIAKHSGAVKCPQELSRAIPMSCSDIC